jgi:hypothetical protein
MKRNRIPIYFNEGTTENIFQVGVMEVLFLLPRLEQPMGTGNRRVIRRLLMWPEIKSDYSGPANAEVQNALNFTSTKLMCFNDACHKQATLLI